MVWLLALPALPFRRIRRGFKKQCNAKFPVTLPVFSERNRDPA